MVEHAICIRCGAEKAHPYDRCGDCRFEPAPQSDDSARSLYFSEFRFSDRQAMGRWLEELEFIAERLQRGERYEFETAEVQRMYVVAEALASQPSSVAWRALFRFFAPALLFLALLWGFYLWLRLSR
jgi:predicted amidophosphoribosyltransferase